MRKSFDLRGPCLSRRQDKVELRHSTLRKTRRKICVIRLKERMSRRNCMSQIDIEDNLYKKHERGAWLWEHMETE